MKSKLFIAVTGVVIVAGALLAYVFVLHPRLTHGGQLMAEAMPAPEEEKHLWHCGMHPWVIKEEPGDCPVCHMKLTPMHSDTPAESARGQKKLLYYWDPMLSPSSISDKPGKSAMGMEMVPVYADEAGPRVTIDPTIVQNMGVRTAEVTRGPLAKTVRTVGILKSPEPGLHDVSLKVSGWIDRLDANQEGMHISKGDVLFEFYSQDLQVAEEELISAVKSERTLDTKASPDLRKEALGLIESVKRKLRLWDVADEDIDAIANAESPPKDVPFRSPASGHMVEKMVVQGTAVQPGMKLMRIEDHTKMWLDAQVYEDQLAVVKIGQDVAAAVDGVPGRIFNGKISFMYPHVDHMTRTLTVRITLDNADSELKPGMYATAEIVTRPTEDALQIPREAVIDTGTRQIVFVAEGEGHFDPRKVRMGITGDDDRVQIIEGLAVGETVVTSGQFLMDVESRTTEAIDKLRKAGPTAVPVTAPDSMVVAPMAAEAQSQPATPMVIVPMATQPQTRASVSSAAIMLSVAYCPMKEANWLQRGESIANPYMGTAMPNCGEITRKLAAPVAGSKLGAVIESYLDVAKGLDADKLDKVAVARVKNAATTLAEEKYAGLRAASAALPVDTNIQDAREQFKRLSDQLISAIESGAK